MLKGWLSRGLDFIVPLTCAACEEPVRAPRLWCDECGLQVQPAGAIAQPPGTPYPLVAVCVYTGPVKTAIHRLKFGNCPELAGRFAQQLLVVLKPMCLPSDCWVVPVPLNAARLVERGYNQAALLAGCIARALRIEHRPCALSRAPGTVHQVGANKAERAVQVSGVFSANPCGLKHKQVLLVDDVITTGATSEACAQALAAAGAQVIAVAAIAHVP